MRVAPCLLAVLLAVGGCGDDGGPPPPPDRGAGQGDDSPGDTPGRAPPDAPPGEAPAATATLERLDASPECDGLVPERVPAVVTARRTPPAGTTCVGGVSDGTGAVAVGARGPGSTSWQTYAPDGTPRRAFLADAPLVPEPSGWHALVSSSGRSSTSQGTVLEHVAIAPDGAVLRGGEISPDPAGFVSLGWNLSSDPLGGCLVAMRATAVAGNHWSSVEAVRFDASGAPRSRGRVAVLPSALEPSFIAGGVSRGGEALVLYQHSASLDVAWLSADSGAPIPAATVERAEESAPVVGPGLSHALELVPLLDGGLALRSDGAFRRRYDRLATRSAPLPPWLAARAEGTYRFTRGNRGYAAFPPAGLAAPDCTQAVELLSPGGRLCGRLVLREEGTACTGGVVDQGWDGTVVQQSGRDACTYRWWPGLLAGD